VWKCLEGEYPTLQARTRQDKPQIGWSGQRGLSSGDQQNDRINGRPGCPWCMARVGVFCGAIEPEFVSWTGV